MVHLKKRSFRRGRLSEQVVAELEKMMLEEYPAGERLPKESELAERFQVSRIVIREAMKLLEGRGVVEVRAGSGTYTVAPSVDKVKDSLLRLFRDQASPALSDMEEMLEIREVLEETVASLAAVRATDADLAEMESALVIMEAGDGGPETVEADLRFHRAVVRAAHNRYFEMMLEPLTSLVIQQIMLTNSYEVGPALHRKILEAIRAGNSVGARQAARRLMRFTLEHTKKAIELFEASLDREAAVLR
jgi:GntR family transcriptional repressor for pyruvate dehydrogenase complex